MIDYDGLNKHRDKIFNDILSMLETNQRVGCVQPTGIGKSYCIARLCNKLKGKKLVLEPGTEVINYMQLFSIETPDTDYITYHSLLRPSATVLANMFKEYDYIFLDEMHRALAPKWGKQLDKTFAILDVLKANYKILGFSATPTRMDNRDAVEEIFHRVQIEPYYLQDAILDGILPNIEYHSSIYEITDKDKNKLKLKDTPLAKQILSYDIDEGVSNIFQENLDLTQPHHIIVFVDKIANIPEAIKNMKKWLKIDFSIYQAHSKMSYKENKEAIENFQKDKNLSLMFAVDVLNEGVHLDKVDTSVFLRKTSSTRIYNQQLGRVISDTIENPKVFDLVNNIDNLETGYASIFKEKAAQLKVKTEQLITKNGEHLKIMTHQDNLIEKLKSTVKKEREWTEEEDKFLRDNYTSMSSKELAIILDRTDSSIRQRKRTLNLVRNYNYLKANKWTKEEDKFLKENYMSMTNNELSKALCRSMKTVTDRLSYLHLHRCHEWTEEEDKFIKENYMNMTDDDIAKILNNKAHNIRSRRKALNLMKQHSKFKWTKEEDKFLKENYMSMTYDELSKTLNKTYSGIKNRVRILNLMKQYSSIKWTKEEDKFLKENYMNMTISELTKALNRTPSSIKNRKKVLGILKGLHKWTKEEDKFLKENYMNMTDDELAKVLNRGVKAVKSRRSKLRLSNYKRSISKPWTKEEDKFLKENYMNMTYYELAKALSRSKSAIQARASRLGIHKH